MAKMQKAVIPSAFLYKTYKLLDDSDINNIVSWTKDGTRFIVKDVEVFSEVVLPKYFHHKNFSSFTRQLRIYGFKRVCDYFHEYEHEAFKKGAYQRLIEIKPKKSTPKIKAAASSNTVEDQVISSSSPPGGAIAIAAPSSNTVEDEVIYLNSPPGSITLTDAEILQENKRLKAENAALKQELHRFRSTLGHVAGLVKGLAGVEAETSAVMEVSGNGAVVEKV